MTKNDELLALSSVELRRRIGTKEISPVELMEAAIARMQALNPAVNAICDTVHTRARHEAKAAEKAARDGEPLGSLHGLPTGIKDLHDAEGLLTTHGSPLYRDHRPARDCAMVANVRKAGAIVVAKTNVPEFGAGANTRNPVWGATGNPFDPRLNAGGSSGGSAVALACDMLPVCTGSDTGGSLRIPAAYCGVVGLRPSPGAGAGGVAGARVDADLGARTDGPNGGRRTPAVRGPDRHGRRRATRIRAGTREGRRRASR